MSISLIRYDELIEKRAALKPPPRLLSADGREQQLPFCFISPFSTSVVFFKTKYILRCDVSTQACPHAAASRGERFFRRQTVPTRRWLYSFQPPSGQREKKRGRRKFSFYWQCPL